MTIETIEKAIELKNKLEGLTYVENQIVELLNKLVDRRFRALDDEPAFTDESIQRMKKESFDKVEAKRAHIVAQIAVL